jgi:hypothetical protein
VSKRPPENLSASVKGRLLRIARERREEFQSTLTRYAAERFLYRLSESPHRQRFVVKGASLFALWLGAPHRPTRDLDLLGFGGQERGPMADVFRAICRQSVADDGLVFDAASVQVAAAREDEKYAGLRVTFRASLGKAVIPMQVDIGFGDAITPGAREAQMPTLLDDPAPRLLTYPRETVVAEKCEAMIGLGLGNSRLKDFYDLWHLATRFDFDGPLLGRAIAATLGRRGTALPALPPAALTAAFFEDAARSRQWSAFLARSGLGADVSLAACVLVLRDFLLPPLAAIRDEARLEGRWRHEERQWGRA